MTLSDKTKKRNAREIGEVLRASRVSAGYTQKAFADALGVEYYTMISQMELGYMAIPPALWVPIADVLRIDRAEFTLLCLGVYQEEVYNALFDKRGQSEVAVILGLLHKGQLDYLCASNDI